MENIKLKITNYLETHPNASSKNISENTPSHSYATIKRAIKELVNEGIVVVIGAGKNTTYTLSQKYKLTRPVDMEAYYQLDIDERKIISNFNLALITDVLPSAELFSKTELDFLNSCQNTHIQRISQLSANQQAQELERLAIDLSWKSSQIEGNTYTLLETEVLLKERKTATGRTHEEAVMLLNHKAAIDFIIEHPDYLAPIRRRSLEDIHRLLVEDLNIDFNIRKRSVGITGTNYRPIDNEYQLIDALDATCALINHKTNPFEKALLALVLISYIQPFADGNKRTARIISNAILLQCGCCPISFRTVNSIDYKKAMLIFYEQNNIQPFKEIFIAQFAFATQTYF